MKRASVWSILTLYSIEILQLSWTRKRLGKEAAHSMDVCRWRHLWRNGPTFESGGIFKQNYPPVKSAFKSKLLWFVLCFKDDFSKNIYHVEIPVLFSMQFIEILLRCGLRQSFSFGKCVKKAKVTHEHVREKLLFSLK